MSRLWVRIIRRHRIARQETAACRWGEERPVLIEVCRLLDVPAPIWLGKHEREFADFRRTSFARDHFVEDVPFDRLEIEYLEDHDRKRRSEDPRNA